MKVAVFSLFVNPPSNIKGSIDAKQVKTATLTVVDDASLLGRSRAVDSLEPATHELRQIESFRRRGQKCVGDVIGEGLKLIWW